jgi:hypothetical protein
LVLNVKKDTSDIIVNTDVLAYVLGFTRQRINQLTRDGVLERQAPGRFPLLLNSKKYVEYLKVGQFAENDDEEGATAQYWEEKALHERAKRETAELKLARLRNQLHDAGDVEMVVTDMLVTFRNRCLAIPGKLAPMVAAESNPGKVKDALQKEIAEALTELSEYSPSLFARGDEIEEEDSEALPEDS